MGDVIEVSPSGRARCRGCKEAIPKGEVRFGELYDSAFTGGEALRYWHLTCAAGKLPGKVRAALAATDIAIPNRAEVDEALRGGGKKGGGSAQLPNASVAPTGRARCLQCDEPVPKGALRVAVERETETPMGMTVKAAGYLHLECALTWAEEQGTDEAEFVSAVLGNSALDEAQLEALAGAGFASS
jgi:Poly(ADP-ribose) polymerase and DNA-Ligase Zn-finger region